MSHGLNLAQLQAVHNTSGPCLVLAGAGSGKTRVITHKMAHLIERGMRPEAIAAITFTNKAAAEMRERAVALIGRAARQVVICTFHALGVRMVRQHAALLGLKPHFSIVDADDIISILKDCAGGTADAQTARQWAWGISAWKSAGLNAQHALAAAREPQQVQLAHLMQRYEERLLAYQSVDFDDLITLPLRLLREHDDVRTHWQRSFEHILIDEYQDTNATQYELLKLLAGPTPRFTAVGDDDQSIYGWRGATLDNLRRLPVDFPNLKVIKLEQNYRSTSAILHAANALIAHNPKLFAKTLFSELGAGEPVRVLACANEEDQARAIVQRLRTLKASARPAPAWRDFAILYRANHQARALEKALRSAGIAYRVSGGTSFFDRSEIRDLCAWFRLLANRADDPAFLRSITTPRRGIGPATLAKLGDFAAAHRQSLFDALRSPMLSATVTVKSAAALQEFGRDIEDLAERAASTAGTQATRAFLHDWLNAIGYERHLSDTADSAPQAAARWANVQDFCDWIAQRSEGQREEVIDEASAQPHATPAKTVLELVRNIALLSTLGEREEEADQVTLSTLHASKGLEWPHVVLAGINEGLLPFGVDAEAAQIAAARTHDAGMGTAQTQTPDMSLGSFSAGSAPSADESPDAARIHEERRLMYVGITRARRTLAVVWMRRRKKGTDSVAALPSRFIAEMQLGDGPAAPTVSSVRERLRQQRQEMAEQAAAQPKP